MDSESIHVAVTYRDDLGVEALVAEFETETAEAGIWVQSESYPDRGPFAGIEWLLPTAVILYVSKPYIDAFLAEAGKDHYHILKGAMGRLGSKLAGDQGPQLRRIYSKGKVKRGDDKYSLVFSVYGEMPNGSNLKLLVEPGISPDDMERAAEAFLEALRGMDDLEFRRSQIAGLDEAVAMNRTILVAYDLGRGELVVVDPMEERRGDL